MSELRRDPTCGAWVVIAPERDNRPRAAAGPERTTKPPPFDPTCPFCPGNESMLPSIIAETPSSETPGWRTRVVPNKFPAVRRNAAVFEHGPLYEAVAARGRHEVVIESPAHDRDLATMSRNEVRDVLLACRDRCAALLAEKGVRCVIIFRNRGGIAGASLRHPHSQAIALEAVPRRIRAREATMRDYYRENGSCLLCDVVVYEQAERSRLVAQNEAFITVTPFAAAAPFEMWILPKRHHADFKNVADSEIDACAAALQDALLRLDAASGRPPYNYVIETASKGESESPRLHWLLRIVPQTTVSAGFELASGLPINPHSPEQDAAVLRSAR